MLSVVMLSIVMLNVVMLNIVMLNMVMLGVVMLDDVMLSFVRLGDVMHSVIMICLSTEWLYAVCRSGKCRNAPFLPTNIRLSSDKRPRPLRLQKMDVPEVREPLD
jgi:hypothetical protein